MGLARRSFPTAGIRRSSVGDAPTAVVGVVDAVVVPLVAVDVGIAAVALGIVVDAGIVAGTTARRWRRRKYGRGLCLSRLCFDDLSGLYSLPSRRVGSLFEEHDRPLSILMYTEAFVPRVYTCSSPRRDNAVHNEILK